jgi:hypothetical protein
VNCLIINNEEFKTSEARIGSKQDSGRLERLFTQLLKYNLFGKKVFENLNKSDMLQTVKHFRDDCCKKNGDEYEYDALILVIMSHGKDGSLITKNDESIFVNNSQY